MLKRHENPQNRVFNRRIREDGLANRAPHPLGAFMVAASLIPVGDAVIVLRNFGTRAAAYGIHGVIAAVLLAGGVARLMA
jgi:hypothetical protein